MNYCESMALLELVHDLGSEPDGAALVRVAASRHTADAAEVARRLDELVALGQIDVLDDTLQLTGDGRLHVGPMPPWPSLRRQLALMRRAQWLEVSQLTL